MRSQIAGPVQVWGCIVLLLCTTFASAQENPDATPAPPLNDPLVVKPTTIEGKFAAALFMLKLARPALARYYLEQTLADEPTAEDMLKLRELHGSGTFLELTAIDALNPPALELLDRMNKAIQDHVSNPGYADALLDKLSGTPRERAEALSELQHLGPYAVPPILKRLADGQHDDAAVLILTLTQLGSNAAPPLVGALTAPLPEIRATAARVLGQIGSTQDAIWLWAPAFTSGEPAGSQVAAREALAQLKYGDKNAVNRINGDGAARLLLAAATQHLNGRYQWPELYDDVPAVPVWNWDETRGTVVEYSAAKTQASIFHAERLAREASLLAPDLQQATVVLLASLLVREVEQNRWDLRLPETAGGALDLAVSCGPELCEQVLRYALDQKTPAAALGALQALSLNGSTERLSSAPPHGAVTAALDAPDSRVQFAAAVTILHWEPTTAFRGSRRVVEILARTLNSESSPASVIMDPNQIRANETAGMFTELGFPASMAPTGMEGFRIAAERGNIELAVLHPNVIRWELSQTIANLRADSRTAAIPVIIYGPAGIRDQFDRISQEYRNVTYLDEGNVPVDLVKNLQPVLMQLSPPPLTEEQRSRQMAEASFWLRRIAIRNVGQVFDLSLAQDAVMASIGKPRLAEDALVTLGAIGTSQSQQKLFSTTTAPAANTNLQALAATQLAFHIQHYGLLLSKSETNLLKSLFQAETDPNLRTALAGVIGTLKPTAAAARLHLLQHPPSTAPLIPAQP